MAGSLAPPSRHSRSWDSIEADESEAHAHADVPGEPLDDDGGKVAGSVSVEEASGDDARGPGGNKWAHAGSVKEVLRD